MKARLLAALLAAGPLLAGDPQALPLRTTLRVENLKLPGDEAMGLVGLSTTAQFGGFYVGPGLYGAARGERGGLFTFGLEGGYRARPFGSLPLEWDAGLFIGGGGGASAPQGGGLMLRPHAGLALTLGRVRLGAELSEVRFPSGAISSSQVAFSLAFTTDRLWTPAWDGSFLDSARWEGRSLTLDALKVDPGASARTRSGRLQPAFDLAGVGFTMELGEPFFRFGTASGAARGDSSGYAQALGGIGLQTQVLGPLGLELRAGVGLGGGGDVDTGGGFLVSGEGALFARILGWQASAGYGFLRAPGGTFQGRTLTLRLAHRFSIPIPRPEGEPLGAFDLTDWRVGSGLLVLRDAPRQNGGSGTVQMMTLRADRLLTRGFYVSAEAGSATGGGAGGFSTGLGGLGWQTPAFARQRLFLEAAAGAGGGGGLRTGGGLLTSFRGGWRVALPLGLGLEASAGRVRAAKDGLDTATFGLGLSLRFATPERSAR